MSKIIKAPAVEYREVYYVTPLVDRGDDIRADDEKEDNELSEAKAQYERIVSEALSQKERILQEAAKIAEAQKKESEQRGYLEGKEKGYNDGYLEGYKKGLEDGRKEAQAIVNEANRLKQQVEEERNRLLRQLEVDVIELVSSCVENIIGDMDYRELYEKVVHEAITRLDIRDTYEVRISEDDYKLLDREYINTLHYKIIADPMLKHGDIVIDTPNGSIDCSMMTQIDNIKKELRSILLDE
ncbi:Flagellar assembly protein FliH [Caldanaerobius fijiensis DSM 17918]|uniref:Flagellar assembly protein FliH n=1 Tax=Caldanaerobius fijiensis DSM 17918 TaxID=1121256 RepID=A0A1M4XN78_9THEO|nr:FliH/SctL family protein [Caldanaerobius fijiensis]SHE95047.1 Flagellar assembly protein FliH [Caldanaerobius fijiensis DSM 17918]